LDSRVKTQVLKTKTENYRSKTENKNLASLSLEISKLVNNSIYGYILCFLSMSSVYWVLKTHCFALWCQRICTDAVVCWLQAAADVVLDCCTATQYISSVCLPPLLRDAT